MTDTVPTPDQWEARKRTRQLDATQQLNAARAAERRLFPEAEPALTPITPPPPPAGPASASPRSADQQALTWPEHLDFSVSHDTDPRAVALNAAAIVCSQGAGANATYSRAATPQDVLEHANAYLGWLTSDLNTPR